LAPPLSFGILFLVRLSTMKRLPLVPGLALLLGTSFLRAELTWETRRIELTPTPFDTAAEAKFGFINNGTEPATIESAKSSCGCTIPTLMKKTYAPGERGEILAHFNIGDRRGTQLVGIQVAIQGERIPVGVEDSQSRIDHTDDAGMVKGRTDCAEDHHGAGRRRVADSCRESSAKHWRF
jgi:hypothetical protein